MEKQPVWELVALEEKRDEMDEFLAREDEMEPDEFFALAKEHRKKMRREYLKDENMEAKAAAAIERNLADMTVDQFLAYQRNQLLREILRGMK